MIETRKSAGICAAAAAAAAVTDVDRGAHELAGRVLHRAVGDLVLQRVDQLDVADRARRLADQTGDALVALAADADRPVDRGRDADLSSTPARPSTR